MCQMGAANYAMTCNASKLWHAATTLLTGGAAAALGCFKTILLDGCMSPRGTSKVL